MSENQLHVRKWPTYPEYKSSETNWLGDVPEHWDVKRLKFCLEQNDSGVWGEDWSEEDGTVGTTVLRSTEQTVDGRWQIKNPAKRSLSPKELRGATLNTGDLVITKSSGSSLHIGKTCLVTKDVAALQPCFSNFMQRLRPCKTVDPRLIYYLLNSPAGRQQLVFNSNTTTGLANLNGTILGNVWIAVPPQNEQLEIAQLLDQQTAKINALIGLGLHRVSLLTEYRSALIFAAITGKIDVRGSEA